jgi:hypothetical protein
MAVSILEQIADDLLVTIAGVNIAAGYNNTLTVERAKQRYNFDDGPNRDNHVVIHQEDPASMESAALNHASWMQPFWCIAYVLEPEESGVAIDTRINSTRADMEKALMVDPTRNSKAADTIIEDPVFVYGSAGELTAVAVRPMIHYRTLIGDPYTQ